MDRRAQQTKAGGGKPADLPVGTRRVYVKPEVTDFGNVREITRGSGSSPRFDLDMVRRKV
jgi:hypothetical protein